MPKRIINTSWQTFGMKVLPLGSQDENDVTQIVCDVSEPLKNYPDAAFSMVAANAGGEEYPVAQAVTDGTNLIWTVNSADTAKPGQGMAQVIMFGADGEIGRTKRAPTMVLESIIADGKAPEPVAEWLKEAQNALSSIPLTINQEVNKAVGEAIPEALEEAKESGVFDGPQGEPGKDGADGADGVSPTISVKKDGKKTTLTITDKSGTKTAEIFDGEDGEDGEDGADGVNTSSNLVNGRAAASLRGIRTKEDGSSDYYVGYAATALGESTKASGSSAFAVGAGANASGDLSAAFGSSTTASGEASHAEGELTIASGRLSHAEGLMAVASGENSHAEGSSTEAASENQHVQGKNNVVDHEGRYAHIVGNGTANDNAGRSNAHTLDWEGNAWFAGKVYVGGTSMDDGAVELGAGGGGSVDAVSDEEVIAYLAELDLLVTVTDGDGTALTDENDNILIW